MKFGTDIIIIIMFYYAIMAARQNIHHV